MIKKRKKCLILAGLILVMLGAGAIVSAQNLQYNLMVPLPQPGPGGNVATTVTGIADYIRTLFLFVLGIGGILAFGVLVFAGFLWLTSGAVGKISKAKQMIGNALLGLALLATAYIILNTINPELVRFEERMAEKVNVPQRQDEQPTDCEQVRSIGTCGAYSDMLGGEWSVFGKQAYLKWKDCCNNDCCDIAGDGPPGGGPGGEKPCDWQRINFGAGWLPTSLDFLGWKIPGTAECVEEKGGGPGPTPNCFQLDATTLVGYQECNSRSDCCLSTELPPGPSDGDMCAPTGSMICD